MFQCVFIIAGEDLGPPAPPPRASRRPWPPARVAGSWGGASDGGHPSRRRAVGQESMNHVVPAAGKADPSDPGPTQAVRDPASSGRGTRSVCAQQRPQVADQSSGARVLRVGPIAIRHGRSGRCDELRGTRRCRHMMRPARRAASRPCGPDVGRSSARTASLGRVDPADPRRDTGQTR